MKELDQQIIESLTIEAEKGNGCAIFDVIDQLSFEERFAALQAINDKNGKRIEQNVTETELVFHAWDTQYEGLRLRLSIDSGSWWKSNTELYNDVLYANATHSGACWDQEPAPDKK